MPAGELKHGTLALVTEGTPVVVVITQTGGLRQDHLCGPGGEGARRQPSLPWPTRTTPRSAKCADAVLRIPRADDLLGPVAAVVPLQLLAYHVAQLRGHDIDQPTKPGQERDGGVAALSMDRRLITPWPMDIIGLGVDLAEISRVRRLLGHLWRAVSGAVLHRSRVGVRPPLRRSLGPAGALGLPARRRS